MTDIKRIQLTPLSRLEAKGIDGHVTEGQKHVKSTLTSVYYKDTLYRITYYVY